MSIMWVRDDSRASTMVLALGSVMVPSTFTRSVNSMAHISSMLYPATLQERDLAFSRRPRHAGQGFSSTRYISRFTDASFSWEVSRLMSIRWR